MSSLVNRGADDRLISFYNYEFDQLNRRTRMISRDGTWDYEYDLAGQLVHAVFTSENPEIASKKITYVYDQVGNRVREIVDGSVTEYSTNNMKQYSRAGGFSYEYDTDGNLVSKTDGTDTWTYEYDDNNRLIYWSGPEGQSEYIYNGLGQLVTTIKDGVKSNYMVDPVGFGNVVGEYDETGALVNRYTHGLGLVSRNDYYYTFDGNGNTSEMTNAATEVVNFYLYEPFGKSLYQYEQSENQFEFVGQFGIMKIDEELIYMRNRFYSANLGRFLSEDQIGLAGGDVSFYRYVLNDPVNLVDPDGLKWGFGVQGGLIGLDFSWKSTYPRKTTVTTGAGTLAAGGVMFGWERDDNSGIFGDILHEILGSTALNIGFGTKSGKFFGLSIAPDLSSVYLNLGYGMSLPLSVSVPIFDIDPFIGKWLYDLLHPEANPC